VKVGVPQRERGRNIRGEEIKIPGGGQEGRKSKNPEGAKFWEKLPLGTKKKVRISRFTY